MFYIEQILSEFMTRQFIKAKSCGYTCGLEFRHRGEKKKLLLVHKHLERFFRRSMAFLVPFGF